MRILDFLLEIKGQLNRGAKDNEFSYFVEHGLAINFRAFKAENEQLALEMNDTLPDICEQMEPGMESEKFHRELSAEVDRLLALAQK